MSFQFARATARSRCRMLIAANGDYSGSDELLPVATVAATDERTLHQQLTSALPRANLLGTRVTVATLAQAEDLLATLVRERVGGYMSCANAFSVTLAHRDAEYRRVINGASMVAADGMSVVWALRILGFAADRVHGDDFFLAC